jgi:hypothetical protein
MPDPGVDRTLPSAAGVCDTLVPERTLIYCFAFSGIYCLVPKKRGAGFKRQPLGRHYCELAELTSAFSCDVYGLDGHLDILCGYVDEGAQADAVQRFVSPIASLLGLPLRQVDEAEFWTIHPVLSKAKPSYPNGP